MINTLVVIIPDFARLYGATPGRKIACKLGPRTLTIEVSAGTNCSGEVTKVAHYCLSVNAMTKPMELHEAPAPYGDDF